MKTEELKQAIADYGTPMYLLNLDRFRENYLELEGAYRKEYEPFRIAYSFKTNYTPAICRTVKELGGYAEVVSDLEYRMAKGYGFGAEDIIVNGPGKMKGIREMLEDGATVMLDNSEELDRAIETAGELDHPVTIGFRLNFEIGAGKNSRFGFDVLDGETERAIERARKSRNIRIRGIHFHLSGARSVAAWQTRAERMIEYAEKWLAPEERGIIDLGSGMFGHMEPALAKQFPAPIPTFGEYAEAVAGAFARHYQNREDRPQLVVEPGTTIVANTTDYITKVIAVKTIRERRIAIVDGSVQQLGELGKKKALPLAILHGSEGKSLIDHAEITGYTCLEDDILYRDCPEAIGVGDTIILGNAGAYSNVLKPPFIQAGCQIIAYEAEKGFRICKREERPEDILASYI